jgi:hypothetical protein
VVWIFPAFPPDVLPVAAARVLRLGGGAGEGKGRVRQYEVAETAGGEGGG